MIGRKVRRAWQMLWLLVMVGAVSCDTGKADESGAENSSTDTIEEDTLAESPLNRFDDAAAGEVNAQCTILRAISLDGGDRRYYVLDICPQDVSTNHQAINISPPDQPAVTTYFDTIRSFGKEEAARKYAEQHGIFDVYFEPES